MRLLPWLAARLDTLGAARRQREAREGWAAQSRPDIRFARCGGVQFRYRERGQGRPIVFTADPPVSLEFYDELLERYAAGHRVIVLELPSMGFSVTDFRFDFRFQAMNDAIAAFLDEIVAAPAVLAFSCVAGLAALDIAARHPATASHLVLIQTPSWDEEVRWKHSRDPRKLLGVPILGQLLMRRLRRDRAPLWLKLAVGRREQLPQFCACAQDSVDRGAGWTLATVFQSYLTDRNPGLAPVTVPTLAIWGERDGSHRDTDRDSSLSLSHGVTELVRFEEAGHFPELESPAAVQQTIEAFLHRTTAA